MGNRTTVQKRVDLVRIVKMVEASDFPITALAVSEDTDMSYYYTRKVLKQLAKEGKIRKFSRATVTYYFRL